MQYPIWVSMYFKSRYRRGPVRKGYICTLCMRYAHSALCFHYLHNQDSYYKIWYIKLSERKSFQIKGKPKQKRIKQSTRKHYLPVCHRCKRLQKDKPLLQTGIQNTCIKFDKLLSVLEIHIYYTYVHLT